jgi:hypothetical protein
LVAFGVGEEVAVEVGDEGFALGFFEREERGLVEGAGDFLHEVQGELAAFAGFLDLFVAELFVGCFDEVVVVQVPEGHEAVEWLDAVVAGFEFHVEWRGRMQDGD